jgi:hypothetical protein
MPFLAWLVFAAFSPNPPPAPAAPAPNQGNYASFVASRAALQTRHSTTQGKIYADPAKAPDVAHRDMAKIIEETATLKAAVILFERERALYWNNPGYWRSYWDRGPGAHFIVMKLLAKLDALAALPPTGDAPYTRVDLNTVQKTLDGCREALDLDRQLQLAAQSIR